MLELNCTQFLRAEAREGKLALVFDTVTLVMPKACALALEKFLQELTE